MEMDNIDMNHHMCLAEFYDAVASSRSEQKGLTLVEIAYTFKDIFDEAEIDVLTDYLHGRYE